MIRIQDIHKIDLHMHTTVSDGTDTPEEICPLVRNAGIDLFSITDHDAVRAAEILGKRNSEERPLFIPGVEFSCKDEGGKYHILGYGYDVNTTPIRDLVAKGHRIRMEKLTKRLDYLESEYGFSFSEEDRERLYAVNNPGKPHIGNMIAEKGYAKTRDEAFEKYFRHMKIKGGTIRPEEAISAILGSGGIPVLAHPAYGSGDQLILGEEMEERLKHLIRFGLEGLEAYYSGFTKRIEDEMLAFADQFGLYVTAGSDYHGRNKLVVLGDTNLGEAAEGSPHLRDFIRRVVS